MNQNHEWQNNPDNYKIKFNPDDNTNRLRRLSQQLNRLDDAKESPLIRLAKKLNPEHADSSSAIAADTENSSNKQGTETTVIKAKKERKDKSIHILTLARNLRALAENIADYLKNNYRLDIEAILKIFAEIASLTDEKESSLSTDSINLYEILRGAEYNSQEMYQTGDKIAIFIKNSLIPYLEHLQLDEISNLQKKRESQKAMANIAELIEQLNTAK